MLEDQVGTIDNSWVYLMFSTPFIVSKNSVCAEVTLVFIGSHLTIIVSVLSPCLLGFELAIDHITIVLIATLHVDHVVGIVGRVAHSIIELILRVIWH